MVNFDANNTRSVHFSFFFFFFDEILVNDWNLYEFENSSLFRIWDWFKLILKLLKLLVHLNFSIKISSFESYIASILSLNFKTGISPIIITQFIVKINYFTIYCKICCQAMLFERQRRKLCCRSFRTVANRPNSTNNQTAPFEKTEKKKATIQFLRSRINSRPLLFFHLVTPFTFKFRHSASKQHAPKFV